MRRFVFTLALLLVLPAAAQAQDTCTYPPSGKVLAGQQVFALFDTVPTDNIEAATIFINGVATFLNPVTKTVAAGPCGDTFRAPVGPFQVGQYTVEVAGWNKITESDDPAKIGTFQQGPKSSPFALSVVLPTPIPTTAPKIRRVGS